MAQLLLLLAAGAGPFAAQAADPAADPQPVTLNSLDLDSAGRPVALPGFWWPPPAAGGVAAGAVVMLHGCGGPYDRQGRLSPRMRTYASLVQAQGLGVLVADSLTPRGERELCTQRIGTRQVTQRNRQRDALGALQWLARQSGVDATRLGLLGWSNGGSTVLAVTNLNRAEVAAAPVRPAFAIAFYPGCEEAVQQGYRAGAALLMLVGADDDWTPPEPCQRLAARTPATPSVPAPQIEQYVGAVHGFDGTAPVVLRRDVPNGRHPGQGVHVGGQPAARDAARARLQGFLAEQLAPR